VIPTERITIKRQLDILRAFAAASGQAGKAVTAKAVADLLKMADSTISMATPFFADIGLLAKGVNGFVPSADVMSYGRAHEWNPDTAAKKLAPTFSKTWFAEALNPKLSFRATEEAEAIDALAEVSTALPEFKPNLRMLVDFLEAVGIVQREGTMIRLARGATEVTAAPDDSSAQPDRESAPAQRSIVSTTFSQATEGVVQFHVSVKVEMAEFANWQPERISAFFAGIAQVLAAKAAIEKGAGKDS
jgi:hypothetical protein